MKGVHYFATSYQREVLGTFLVVRVIRVVQLAKLYHISAGRNLAFKWLLLMRVVQIVRNGMNENEYTIV